MKKQGQAFIAEIYKNKSAAITWITFLAFSMAPVFGAVFMIMMSGEGYEGLSGAFKTKAVMFSFEANWPSFLGILSQAVGIGGVVIFGFVASWLFGREYSDGTAKDLMALPISRSKILNAKFMYYTLWCVALVISNLLLGLLFGSLLGLPGWEGAMFAEHMKEYFIITVMVMMLNTPIAFFALVGRGYLLPLGIVIVLLVLAQIFGAMGFGTYFPWAVPGLYSGSGGPEMKAELNMLSYVILVVTGLLGYVLTLLWWKYTDQG